MLLLGVLLLENKTASQMSELATFVSCALADRLCWLSISRMTTEFRLVLVKQITVMLLWARCGYGHSITNPALIFDIAISCCLLVSVLFAIFALFSLAVAAGSASALLSSRRYPLSPCRALFCHLLPLTPFPQSSFLGFRLLTCLLSVSLQFSLQTV